jgi:hypothetical protein
MYYGDVLTHFLQFALGSMQLLGSRLLSCLGTWVRANLDNGNWLSEKASWQT